MLLPQTLTGYADIRGYEISYEFDHIRPDGSAISGLTGLKGENIAMSYKTAEKVMNAWKASPGHNSTMLKSTFTKVGVAVFCHKITYEDGYSYYTVQIFG